MKRLTPLIAVLALAWWSSAAHARCVINAAGLIITPVTASTGTYTPPTAPTAQSVTFALSGTYNSTTAANPICTVAISFNRASSPVTMARSGGGATLPYTIQSTAGGGNTLIYIGGATPALTNLLTFSFNQAGLFLTNQPFNVSLTAFFLAQPGSPQLAGSYSDALALHIFNVRQGNNALTDLASRAFTVTGTVAKSCTIAGVATPAADTASIPVSSAGVVNTAPISRSYVSVACNALSNLQVTSQSGAVKRTASAPGGFTNLINYTALASFSGASSTVNTATVAAATAAEAGTVGTTSTSTPSGTLAVTITPQTSVQRLVQGSYTDTLRVTITPQ